MWCMRQSGAGCSPSIQGKQIIPPGGQKKADEFLDENIRLTIPPLPVPHHQCKSCKNNIKTPQAPVEEWSSRHLLEISSW
jgi:hypothetical protein